MKKNNDKKPLNSEHKLELAKAIAEKSKSIKETYNSIETKLVKGFKQISSWIDYILFTHRFGKLVAVLLALLLYLIINGPEQNVFTPQIQQSVSLDNIAVISNISDSVYEVDGLPESVDVIVRGESSDVQFAIQQKDSLQILADLEAFGEGTYEVVFQPVNFSDKVDVIIEPSTAVVSVKKKISSKFTIGYDYINADKMDSSFSLSTPEFSQTEVVVKASEETLNEVAFVKALINLDGIKGDFVQDCILVAYDQKGDRIDVDILPDKVSATVKVSKPSKEVKIVVKSEGNMSDGYAIESYTLDHDTMLIYAQEEVLEEIDEVEVFIPVNKITSDTIITMPIMLPANVTSGSINKVSINLKVTEANTETINAVKVETINVNDKLKATVESDSTMDVIVHASDLVLSQIHKDNIYLIVDLDGYDKAGTYEVEVEVESDIQFAWYTLAKDKIKIKLEEK